MCADQRGPAPIGIEVERTRTRAIVRVSGSVDLHTAPDLVARVLSADMEAVDQLVLDVTAVEFMDSSGLVALLNAYELHGERLRIIAGPSLEAVLRHSGARSFLPLDQLPAAPTPEGRRDAA